MVAPLDWQPYGCLSLADGGTQPFIAFVTHNTGWDLNLAWPGTVEPQQADWVVHEGPAFGEALFGLSLDQVDGGHGVGAYLNGGASDLVYMSSELANPMGAGDWQSHTVQSEDSVGYPCALLISDGAPALAYVNDTRSWVMFAQAGTAAPVTAGDWERHTVVESPDTIESLDAAVVNGHPCIAYVVNGNVLCAWAKTVAPRLPRDWAFSTAASDFTDDYDDVSVADVGGHPGVSFYNSTTEHLMYAEMIP